MLHSSGIRNRNVCLDYLSITGSGIRHRMIDKLMLDSGFSIHYLVIRGTCQCYIVAVFVIVTFAWANCQ